METRANYVLVGVFTLAVILGAFGFVWWFERVGDQGARTVYEVLYEGSVAGVRRGSAVNFNGIRAGEVYSLDLDKGNPNRVIVQIGISPATPVRSDTKAGLEYQGLTGIAAVSLTGGRLDAPPIVAEKGKLPRLVADVSQSQDLMQTANKVVGRIDKMLIENEQQIKEMIVQIGAAGKSVRDAADTLGKTADSLGKTAEPTLLEYQHLAKDARRAVGEITKLVRDLEKNPSQIVWGKKTSPTPSPTR